MGRKLDLVEPRNCKTCGRLFCMEDVGLIPSNARHRLRFRQMKTCGNDFCKKKAMASRPAQNYRKIFRRGKRTRDDAALECQLYLNDFLCNVHPDLIDGMSAPGPDIAEYRKMMGIRC